MGERPIECGIRSVKLGQRAFVQGIETIEQLTQFLFDRLIFGIVTESGAAHEFGDGQFSGTSRPLLYKLLVAR
jgi:hypothetical protein